MRKLSILFAVATFFMQGSAHAQSPNIHENVDPYTHLRTLLLVDIPTSTCKGDPPPLYTGDLRLAFAAQEWHNHNVTYSLTVELNGGNQIAVRSKSTMDVLLDGAVGQLKTPDGATINYLPNAGGLHETIIYPLTRQQIQALGQVQLFQFRVNGQSLSVQRCVAAKRMRDLNEFLAAATDYTH